MEGSHVEPVAGESWKQVEPIMLMIPPSQASCRAGETTGQQTGSEEGGEAEGNSTEEPNNTIIRINKN